MRYRRWYWYYRRQGYSHHTAYALANRKTTTIRK